MNKGEPLGRGLTEAPKPEDVSSGGLEVQEKEETSSPLKDEENQVTPEITIEEAKSKVVTPEQPVLDVNEEDKPEELKEDDVTFAPIYTTEQASDLQEAINSSQE